MDNCPNQFILFGPSVLMDRVRAELGAKGAVCIDLPQSWAYHTPFVAPMADAFADILHAGLVGTPEAIVYSCATAAPFPSDVEGIRATMHAQYVSRVRFDETVRRLHDDGVRTFVEVGPGGVLTGFVGDILRERPHLALAADSRRAPGLDHLLGVLGQLFVNQLGINLVPLHAAEPSASPRAATLPVLDSTLPFIQLDESETARVRAMLDVAAPSAVPALPLDEPRVAGWTGHLPLPFQARVEMVSLDASADEGLDARAFGAHLTAGDITCFDRDIVPCGAKRQRDWLAGRMAARRAVGGWRSDAGLNGAEPEIGYDAAGRPILTGAPSLFLSVSHKDGIGAAAAADRPVGIDLERLGAIRDPAYLIGTAFSLEEGALLAEAGWADTDLIAIAWSAKEAAAKSRGRKLLGQELAFAITHVDQERETIRLADADGAIDASYAVDGDFVCVVAG